MREDTHRKLMKYKTKIRKVIYSFLFDTQSDVKYIDTLALTQAPSQPPLFIFSYPHTQSHTGTHLYNYIPTVRLSIISRLRGSQQFKVY